MENPENLQLLNGTVTIQSSVAIYYVTQLYNQNPSFNPVRCAAGLVKSQLIRASVKPESSLQLHVCLCYRLPGQFLCAVPSFALELLGGADSLVLIQRINVFCNGTESPEVINQSIGQSVSQSVSFDLLHLGFRSPLLSRPISLRFPPPPSSCSAVRAWA